MQDADEGTSFENVQTASVKRHLANDANDNKLYNVSMMELIGHLSKDNKETYLKHAQPLQKYIDAKDEFDFKHNNYTTTKNIDTTPDEKVRQLQRELNEAGYTDKFGQRLKEDGVYAGKTAYADDSMKADTLISNNTYTSSPITDSDRYRYTAPSRSGYSNQRIATPTATNANNDVKLLSNKNDTPKSFIQPLPKYENKFLNQQIKKKEEMIYGTGNEKKNDPRQTYNYIAKKAKELDLPLDLCLATAFKESSFRHYEYDASGNLTVHESAGDYGLMQINDHWHKEAFTNKDAYGDIVNNWHDNIDYGLNHLKTCYEEAKWRDYTGDELLKATYSNYNTDSCSAYKDPNHPVHLIAKENVNGFWNVYKNKTWFDVLN